MICLPTELPWQPTQLTATTVTSPRPKSPPHGMPNMGVTTLSSSDDGLTYCGKCNKFSEDEEKHIRYIFKNAIQKKAAFSVPGIEAQLKVTEAGRKILTTKTPLNVQNKIKHLRKKFQ